jgi:hypothetical protein
VFSLDFPWLGKCCVLVYLDLYIYFGFPLARSKWSILFRIVKLPLQSLLPTASPSTPSSSMLPQCYSAYSITPSSLVPFYSHSLYVIVVDYKSRRLYALLSLCKGTSVHLLTLPPLISPILSSPLNSYSTLCICTPSYPCTNTKSRRLSSPRVNDLYLQ